MNKYLHIIQIYALLLFIGAMNTSHAQTTSGSDFKPFLTRGETTWAVQGGIRQNTFDWNIASDETGAATPNILSELTWRDLTILEVEGEVRHEEPLDIYKLKGGLHLEAKLKLGYPITGENQDSDYFGDNRTQEFSRTIGDADGGYAVGAKAAVGYKMYLTGAPGKRARDIRRSKVPLTASGRLRRLKHYRESLDDATPVVTLTPLLGYTVDQQDYRMKNNTQRSDSGFGPLGPIGAEDFDWHYLANWYGPFIGLETEIKGRKNAVKLRGEYQNLDFYGEGFWRGRGDFRQDPSYRHEVDADGILLNAEYAYALGEDYALIIDGEYHARDGTGGIDRTYFVDNSTSTIRLNEVNDQSYGLHAGVRYNW